MFIIRQFTNADLDDVVNLWESCGLTRPWNNPETDIFRKVSQQDDLFLVAIKDEQLIGTLMGGYDGHRGWINYLAVHPHQQRLGIATALVQQLEKRLMARGCPKFSVHDKFHRTLILSGFCLLKIAKISLNSSFFPKPIKR